MIAYDSSNEIIQAYINWYKQRTQKEPTQQCIQSFFQDGYWYVKQYAQQGYNLPMAINKWSDYINE